MGVLLQCTLKKKKKKTNPDCRAGDYARYLFHDLSWQPMQFPEEEYINGIFIAVYKKKKILIAGLEIMRGTWFHDLSWQPMQFPEEEYINGIFVAVYIKKNPVCRAGDHGRYLVPRPLLAAHAIPRRGIHKWDFCCSVLNPVARLEIMHGTWFHDLSWQPVQFPEEEYINGIFVAVYIKKNFLKILIAGLEIMRGTWFHDLSWQPAQFPEEEYINGIFVAV
jgi:hypothetical protein